MRILSSKNKNEIFRLTTSIPCLIDGPLKSNMVPTPISRPGNKQSFGVSFFYNFFWVRAPKGHRSTGGLALAPEKMGFRGEPLSKTPHRVRERRFI